MPWLRGDVGVLADPSWRDQLVRISASRPWGRSNVIGARSHAFRRGPERRGHRRRIRRASGGRLVPDRHSGGHPLRGAGQGLGELSGGHHGLDRWRYLHVHSRHTTALSLVTAGTMRTTTSTTATTPCRYQPQPELADWAYARIRRAPRVRRATALIRWSEDPDSCALGHGFGAPRSG